MEKEKMTELARALMELDEKRVYQLVDEKIKNGISPLDIIAECNEGMAGVGDLFSAGQYFLSQMLFAAEIFKNIMKQLEPIMPKAEASTSRDKVVIGTVKGDIHDIGKNIVVNLLRGSGFEVIDLGVDVPAEKFVEALRETGARVLGLSALLNFTYPEMKTVVEAVTEAGLRDKVTIIIGGAPCNEQVRQFTGADYYAEDAVAGVNICKKVYS
ncbi:MULTISPECIES: cobalamin B12-binding domain-containing protein [Desulfofundulus]|uniref:Methylmalonyl-CoA mutase C-terminal domain-containing protein n=2 Tax=Desulfofundulus TaxID=2282741 RepID=A0A1M6MDT3_9FIRM|nr:MULTISPECIES: corrinoid protein [Desulfofundulus]MDQ0285180.1 methylmalonyl-CoA mutase cobalamin-binding domain/chain [Desulfofundulus luciae]SHJ81622.1 methylmalonyl-CoA mutase C-terminal domain-containing protein [Desulfofundulus thermosubterraneus DSM 16057]